MRLMPSNFEIAWQEAQHALLAEAPVEGPDRIRMRTGFLGALGGGAISKEHQGMNHFVALLCLIHEP